MKNWSQNQKKTKFPECNFLHTPNLISSMVQNRSCPLLDVSLIFFYNISIMFIFTGNVSAKWPLNLKLAKDSLTLQIFKGCKISLLPMNTHFLELIEVLHQPSGCHLCLTLCKSNRDWLIDLLIVSPGSIPANHDLVIVYDWPTISLRHFTKSNAKFFTFHSSSNYKRSNEYQCRNCICACKTTNECW